MTETTPCVVARFEDDLGTAKELMNALVGVGANAEIVPG
jgi:hypothetical protein